MCETSKAEKHRLLRQPDHGETSNFLLSQIWTRKRGWESLALGDTAGTKICKGPSSRTISVPPSNDTQVMFDGGNQTGKMVHGVLPVAKRSG